MKRNKPNVERKTALCYIRQSFTRAGEPDDLNSPERQRANIQAVCDRNSWSPEWYEDVGGHKSGRSEKNRPGWLALKTRLGDPDIAALVANDLSRLHRKGWRVGDLIEFLNEHTVDLVLAAPGRDVDTTTMKGRMFLQFGAIIDEFYAEDISQRAKDSVLYRKSLGKSIGIPPFGAIRGEDGFLKPSSEGAWLLPNGIFVAGRPDSQPEQGALWRGYYEAARYALTLYATGLHGFETIAYTLNDEGWPFRDRNGNPRTLWRDDIRRIVSNWPEYGGIVTDKRSKDRPAYEELDVNAILFREDRAIFPIELLRGVAQMRYQRSHRPVQDHGVNQNTYFYPLSGITYCAHCEGVAEAHGNSRLRSRLGGIGGRRAATEIPRYRHKPGTRCGCRNRSVPCETYESDFTRLIHLLTVKPEAISIMTELAIQADRGRLREDVDIEAQKEEAIALCNRRIDAAVHLYKDGEIDRVEYLNIRESNEREIAHWQVRTTETQRMAVELAMCIEAVDKLSRLWDISDPEDRRGLAHSLFEYIIYDLDAQRITDFRLKPWADRFLTTRADLIASNDEEEQEEKGDYIEKENSLLRAGYGYAPRGMRHHTIPVLYNTLH
jgi:DNA invertase Pin-like site-specific DNA recombinase